MRRTGAVHAGISWCVAGLLLGLGPAAREAGAAELRPAQPVVGARVASLLQADGFVFKDLNKNGRLDPYEDWRRPVAERVDDLVSQMTLEEKAGLMVGPSLAMGPGGTVREEPVFGRTRSPAGRRPSSRRGRRTPSTSGTSSSSSTGRTPTRGRWRRGRTPCSRWRRPGGSAPPSSSSRTPATTTAPPPPSGSPRPRAPSRSGRGRSASPRRATWRSSRSSPGSPRRSTSRWGSGAPTTRRPTSRPSRGGDASARRSARTPTSRRS